MTSTVSLFTSLSLSAGCFLRSLALQKKEGVPNSKAVRALGRDCSKSGLFQGLGDHEDWILMVFFLQFNESIAESPESLVLPWPVL